MAQITNIAKDVTNIATSNVGGMLFPANGTDHPLLMAYYLKWGLQLTDNRSLDTTQEVIDYLLEKISESDNKINNLDKTINDLNNRIANLEDQTEYTITVSSSSKAKCDLTKIKKSGGTVTITPESGYKITGVQATNCSITHIDNTNKYQITNVIDNIMLTVDTIAVDIKINGENLSKLSIIREKNDTVNSITQNGGKINPTSITINQKSQITAPTSITLHYGNKEGSVNLIFSGADNNKNSIPDVTVDSSKLTKSNLTSSSVTLTSKGNTTKNTIVRIKFTDANNLYEKIFDINVSITNENSLEDVDGGWQYFSSNPDVADINIDDLTITGKKSSGEPVNITISYLGKCASIGYLTVTPESKKYYWYVGQENPANMTSISPIVTDNTSPGWRLIGTTIPTYSASNKLFDDSSNSISLGGRVEWYVAIPTKSSAIVRDGLGNDGTQVAICVKQSNVTINGVEYKVFKSDGTERSFSYPIY